MSLFANDMVAYAQKLKNLFEKLPELINKCFEFAKNGLIYKSIMFFYILAMNNYNKNSIHNRIITNM